MPKEIDFSSYECDCGHQSHFFANTIKEAKAVSQKRTVRLGDSEADQHTIVLEYERWSKSSVPKRILSRNPEEKALAVPNDRTAGVLFSIACSTLGTDCQVGHY